MATSTRSRYFRLLFAVALIFALMTPLAAAAQDPQPHFSVDPDTGAIWGHEWLAESTITITIDGSVAATAPTYDGGNFSTGVDPAAVGTGALVVVSDGISTKDHAVTAVRISGVDQDAETINGVAGAGTAVNVEIYDVTDGWRWEIADVSGAWMANFSIAGDEPGEGATFDLGPSWNGAVFQTDDDGDGTRVHWRIPNPTLRADPVERAIFGDEWPPGNSVAVTLNGADLGSAPVGDDGYFWINDVDLAEGDVITGTDGETVKDMVVEGLTYSVDPVSDRVFGTGDPGENWLNWVHEPHAFRSEIADGAGAFTADFSVPGADDDEQDLADIGPGTNGESDLCDAEADCTIWRWSISNPIFRADPYSGGIWGHGWDDVDEVTVNVDGAEVETVGVDGNGDWGTGVDPAILSAGIVVTVTGGDTTKALELTALSVTVVDEAGDAVLGTATPDSEVFVEIHDAPEGIWRRVIASNPSGDWTADFTDPISNEDGEGSQDFAPGVYGAAYQEDVDGDTTWIDWWVREPRISVEPQHESLWGSEFAPNASVAITINGTDHGILPTDEWGNWGEGWDPGDLDIQAYDEISVTDTTTTKVHTVTPLAITDIALDTNIMSGTALANHGLSIWVHDTDANEWVVADGAGNWTVDWTSQTDIVRGSNGNSHECDDDGDCTWAGWGVPNPRVDVDPRHDGVWGDGWIPDDVVTIFINDVEHSTLDTDEWGNFGEGWDPQGHDVAVGDKVDVTQGDTTKTHYVTSLAITGMDVGTEIMTGTSDGPFDIWVHDTEAQRHVDHDGVGEWSVDWSIPGPNEGEGATADLEPGTNGNSNECDNDGDCTWADWNIATPIFRADPVNGGIWGHQWYDVTEVTVTTDTGFSETVPVDENGDWNTGTDPADVVAGTTVTVTGGDVTKNHVVTELTVIEINQAEDAVIGTAEPGTEVWIGIRDIDDEVWRMEVADLNGDWTADFTVFVSDETGHGSITFEPGTAGSASQSDDDYDTTTIDWQIANPRVDVDPRHDGVWGDGWIPDDVVTIFINDVEHSTLDTDEWGNFGEGWDPQGHDVAVGDKVDVTQGDTTKTHYVTSLAITGMDVGTEIMTGTSDGPFDIWVHDTEAQRHVDHDGVGEWSVDWSIPGPNEGEGATADLEPGTNGNSNECDNDGDCTWADWNIANPQFSVETPFSVWSHGEGWVEGRTVTLIVDVDEDPTNGVEYLVDDIQVERWGPEPWDVGWYFEIEDGFEIEPGHFVSVYDGVEVSKYLWVEALEISEIDEDADTISGTATAGMRVEVNAGNDEYEAYRSVEADEDGDWLADFANQGDEEHEQDVFDIAIGTGGAAQIFDDDGDSTHRGWSVEEPPDPNFFVRSDGDELWGHEWYGGGDVTITIDEDDDSGNGVLFETMVGLEDGYFEVYVGDEFDILPGQYVVVTDGVFTKAHWVAELTVTEVDADDDMVHGTTGPGAEVFVGSSESGPYRIVEAGPGGNWTADFSVPWEDQEVLDIVLGTGGYAEESDEDGDATHAGWQAAADSAIVEGHVTLDGDPLPDVEVGIWPDRLFVCTGGDGYFSFEDVEAAEHEFVATGTGSCGNSEFVDADGKPLLAGFVGDSDLTDGYEYIEIQISRADAHEYVTVLDNSTGSAEPVDGVSVSAFDRNDPAFVAEFGHDPDPADYQSILDSGIAQIAWDPTGLLPHKDPGVAELRFVHVTDVLILAELDPIQGALVNSDEFVDRGDGVLVGPEIVFEIGEAGPAVAVEDVVMNEGNRRGRAFVTFVLDEPVDDVVTAEWTTEDGTAFAGEDYLASGGTITFNPGQTEATRRIRILGDTMLEDDESFHIVLLSVDGAAAGEPGTVTLLNDDAEAPELSVEDVEVLEGNRRGKRVAVTFTLSEPAPSVVSVVASTVAGTALPGDDYLATTRTVRIGAGSTSATLYVRVVSDTVPEPDEFFTIEATNPVGVTIVDGSGEVLILNDD